MPFRSLAVVLFLTATAVAADRPNIVVVFTDDQGYGDVGCYGAEGYQTPHLDRMAAEGMRFTDFHVAHFVCSPSRAALLTGRYPQRLGINGVFFPFTDGGLAPEELTVAELLKTAGYATGIVGKWHLGHDVQYLPTSQGFDSYYGVPYSNDMGVDGEIALAEDVVFREGLTREDYLTTVGDEIKPRNKKTGPPLLRGEETIEWPVDQTTLTKRYTEEAVGFIEEHADGPFFLYLAHTMPHIPLAASPEFAGRTERGLYGDVIEEIDWSVGCVLDALRSAGIAENTLVIFTTDNGPWLIMGDRAGSAGPLREGKASSYEGGQRVPCIAWWPGHVPAGSTCEQLVTALDLFPTAAGFAGVEVPRERPLDGFDVRGILLGQSDAESRYEDFVYARDQAIRVGDWKYRRGPIAPSQRKKIGGKKANRVVEQLFNLAEDVGEKNNLIEQYPEKAAELRARLAARKQLLAEDAQ